MGEWPAERGTTVDGRLLSTHRTPNIRVPYLTMDTIACFALLLGESSPRRSLSSKPCHQYDFLADEVKRSAPKCPESVRGASPINIHFSSGIALHRL